MCAGRQASVINSRGRVSVLSGDPESGEDQRHELRVVASYRLGAKTEVRRRGRLLDPGWPDENAERISGKPGTSRGRAANIGLPANRRAGTATNLAQPPSGISPQEPKVRRLTAGGDWIRNFSSAPPLVVARVCEIRDLGRAAGRIGVRSLECRRERIRTPVGSRR